MIHLLSLRIVAHISKLENLLESLILQLLLLLVHKLGLLIHELLEMFIVSHVGLTGFESAHFKGEMTIRLLRLAARIRVQCPVQHTRFRVLVHYANLRIPSTLLHLC